jgi:hypothetical protein
MIAYINKRIKATSVYNIGKGIVWIMVALSLVYVFNFWYKAPTEGYLWIGIIIFDIFFLLLVIAGIWEIVVAVKYLFRPLKHPSYKLLEKYPEIKNIEAAVDMELSQCIKPFSNTILTQNWLFKNSITEFAPIYIKDLAWAYEKKITTTLNTIITVGKDFYIVLHTAKGQEVEIPVKKTEAEAFLNKIYELNKSVRLGYTDENKLWWENNAPKNNN